MCHPRPSLSVAELSSAIDGTMALWVWFITMYERHSLRKERTIFMSQNWKERERSTQKRDWEVLSWVHKAATQLSSLTHANKWEMKHKKYKITVR